MAKSDTCRDVRKTLVVLRKRRWWTAAYRRENLSRSNYVPRCCCSTRPNNLYGSIVRVLGIFRTWKRVSLFISFCATIICRLTSSLPSLPFLLPFPPPPPTRQPASFPRPLRRDFLPDSIADAYFFRRRNNNRHVFKLETVWRRALRLDFLRAVSFILFKICLRGTRGLTFFNRTRVANKHDFCFKRCK